MADAPQNDVERISVALLPFLDADLVQLFRSEEGVTRIREALKAIAADDLTTLMIGADRGLTGTFEGIDGFVEAWHDFTETFQSLRNEITDISEVHPGVIYAPTRQFGTTATAGVEIDYEAAAIFRFSDGKLRQAEFHLDQDSARRAAGID